MEYTLVINFQFSDKEKQKKICDAFFLYEGSKFDEFSKVIDRISGEKDTLDKYPSLTPESGPESITKLTRAGNSIIYFLCGSSDGEEKGDDLRSLLIQLGAAKFKGYLESDDGEKYNLKKHTEQRRAKQKKNINSTIDINNLTGSEINNYIKIDKLFDDHVSVKRFDFVIASLKTLIDKFPDNEPLQFYLAETYVLDNQDQEALSIFKGLYVKHPDSNAVISMIIEVYDKLNKNIEEFDWIKPPKLLTANREILDICFEMLSESEKGKFWIWQFIYKIKSKDIGCVNFSEDELLSAIKKDNRFSVEDTHNDVSYAKIFINS
jgi:hypothetical protein